MGLLVKTELGSEFIVGSIVLNLFLIVVSFAVTVYFFWNVSFDGFGFKQWFHKFHTAETSIAMTIVTQTNNNNNSRTRGDIDETAARENTATQSNAAALSNAANTTLKIESNVGWCIVAMFAAYLFQLSADAFLTTDYFLPTHLLTTTFCQITISALPVIYMTHKAILYWVFAFRIEHGFRGSAIGFPAHYYKIFRYCVAISVVIFGILTAFVISPFVVLVATSDGSAHYCSSVLSPKTSPQKIWPMIVFQIMDGFFNFTTLWAYVSRLSLVLRMTSESTNPAIIENFHSVIKKSTILVIVATMSTTIGMIIGVIEMKLLILYIAIIDTTINNYCVVMLFQLPMLQRCYDVLCGCICGRCCLLNLAPKKTTESTVQL